MTENFIARLRECGATLFELECAEALEAKDARIAELEAWNAKCEEARNCLIERNRTLADALKPFADQYVPKEKADKGFCHIVVYAEHLRAARAALGEKE